MGRWAATPEPPKRSRYGNGRGAQTCSQALTGISVQLKMASVRAETTTLSQGSRSLACRTSPRLAPTGDRFVDGAASVPPARARASPVETNRPVEAVLAARLKPRGSRTRLLSHRSRASTDAAVHRHAGPADGRHSPRSAAAASPREAGRLVAACSGAAATRPTRSRRYRRRDARFHGNGGSWSATAQRPQGALPRRAADAGADIGCRSWRSAVGRWALG